MVGQLNFCKAPDFLAPVPPVTRFGLRHMAEASLLACLADSFRAHASNLGGLELDLYNLQILAADVLSDVPVTHLALDVAGEFSLPAELPSKASHLTYLKLHDNSPRNGKREVTLPALVLANTSLPR